MRIVIGTKWVFRNKLDENGIISRNKARLVVKGYNQDKRIEYEETYAHLAHLKVIIFLLEFTFFLNYKLYQMDVKYVFLKSFKNKEVCLSQLSSFEEHESTVHVFKLKRAFFGLVRDPKSWYELLSGFLLKK